MLNIFSKPYIEYSLLTTLSKNEFIVGLQEECSSSIPLSWDAFKAAFNATDFERFRLQECSERIILAPIGRGRNSLRALLHCTVTPSPNCQGSTIAIVMKPLDTRWLLWGMIAILFIFSILQIAAGNYLLFLAPCAQLAGACLILHLCRSMAEREIPLIQAAFEKLVRRMEGNKSKYAEKKQDASVLDKITFACNLLVALPICCFFALLALVFPYQMLVSRGIQPPSWLMWSVPIASTLILFLIWGCYQYRLCLLKRP